MSEADKYAIVVDDVSKSFVLPHENQGSVKNMFVNIFRKHRKYEKQHVLNDISFKVKKGEFFGIVGRNGSGKSTLLKVLAGIYMPDKGNVHIEGKLTPFIELGVGFNPDLTGRENVFLNGALLGFNRREMEAMYDDIVAFAELEQFMDQKLKNYSSGMQVRLAFSIAIKSQSDVLLFDEVLAVGDEGFQKKCVNAFRDLKAEGRTIILVTHDMGNVERFCDRVLIVDKSKYVAEATPAKAASIYARLNIDEDAMKKADAESEETVRMGSGEVRVAKLAMSQDGEETKTFTNGKDWTMRIDLERAVGAEGKKVVCGLAFHNADGVLVAGPNNTLAPADGGSDVIEYSVAAMPLAPGDYTLTVVLFDENVSDELDKLEKWYHFSVISDRLVPGLVRLDGEWKSRKD